MGGAASSDSSSWGAILERPWCRARISGSACRQSPAADLESARRRESARELKGTLYRLVCRECVAFRASGEGSSVRVGDAQRTTAWFWHRVHFDKAGGMD